PRSFSGAASVVVTFANASVQPGAASIRGGHVRTGDPRIDETLASIKAHRAHRVAIAPSAGLDLSRTYLLHVSGTDARSAARALAATPGVLYARPDLPIGSMATDLKPMPDADVRRAQARSKTMAPAKIAGIPSNFGLQSSMQAYLNSTGVNAVGAFVEIAQRFGQLPGEGTIITNVSLGDLMDQSMADAGDFYDAFFGPTTIVRDGQRYLDFPSLPLIPTFTVAMDGTVDPLGSVEHVDPALGEVLLDFSVMAPLPHDRQRPEALGEATTDLLGIAPGAQYRLVVPQEPTMANIAVALLAAAQQVPRPDVINASLGFGFDTAGFPGRYLEDDPLLKSVVETIVQQYGIVVCIAANDGTRIFTPAAVPAQGGSAPMDLLPRNGTPTSADEIGFSTARSLIPDTGSIAVGGSTLDDIFSVQPHAVDVLDRKGQFATTRYNGSGGFSSGFGTRVNLSAPSDNIAALAHTCLLFFRCTPQDAVTVLSGGTSASAPMTAAAAAVVIQVSRLVHHPLTPLEVRDLLVRTARPLPAVPQADTDLHVGPQLDVTAAVEALLGRSGKEAPPAIARLAIAHRQTVAGLGGTFIEITDPANIDLLGNDDGSGFASGQPLVGPITFAPDLVNVPKGDVRYVLRVGSVALESRSRTFQLFPAEILSYAGLPVASESVRSVPVTYEVHRGGHVLASVSTRLNFGPTDGTFSEALAPTGPAAIAVGHSVRFHYDLTGVRFVNNPALVVSSVNHWSPAAAPQFRIEARFPLAQTSGEVTIPASAFTGGAGLYGVGILVDPDVGFVGEFAAIRVGLLTSDDRPEAPLLADASGTFGHIAFVTRAASTFRVQWDARDTSADGAILEISAAGPTLFSL
ncbi:MAG: S8 family serine peptidase, partial [Myxococcales bacterium]